MFQHWSIAHVPSSSKYDSNQVFTIEMGKVKENDKVVLLRQPYKGNINKHEHQKDAKPENCFMLLGKLSASLGNIMSCGTTAKLLLTDILTEYNFHLRKGNRVSYSD